MNELVQFHMRGIGQILEIASLELVHESKSELERNSTTNHVASGCSTQLCGSTNIDNTLPGFTSSAHLSPEPDDLSRLSDISGQSSTGLFDVDDFLGVFVA
ncbi:unnamed protein product [Clavelina lepadiformis]|uniref:Uncharacterized protein n=1 Tax=Clavelina lepadiformis TaxID=159417 RepID=A0ABP0FME4_CLALP